MTVLRTYYPQSIAGKTKIGDSQLFAPDLSGGGVRIGAVYSIASCFCSHRWVYFVNLFPTEIPWEPACPLSLKGNPIKLCDHLRLEIICYKIYIVLMLLLV